MVQIIWTEKASENLHTIRSYISEKSPKSALKVVRAIYDKIQILKEFPEIGGVYYKDPRGDIRIIRYGHYRIAYLVKSEHIEIVGIFHEAMDIHRYL